MFKRALPDPSEEERSAEGFSPCVPPDVVGIPFPTAEYDQNLFYAAVGYLLGLAMTMVSENNGGRFSYLEPRRTVAWISR